MSNEVIGPRLKGFVERYERLETEKAEIAEAQRELLAEVKGAGFDKAVFLEAVKARKQDPAAAAERSSLLTSYLEAAK